MASVALSRICYHTLGAPEEENWWVGLSFTLLFLFSFLFSLSLSLFFLRVVSWNGIMYEGCQKVSRIILGWNLLKCFILAQTSCRCQFESGDCNRTMVKLMFIESLLLCSDHFVYINWLNPYNPVTLVLLLSGGAVLILQSWGLNSDSLIPEFMLIPCYLCTAVSERETTVYKKISMAFSPMSC